jgi:hypothetical protein
MLGAGVPARPEDGRFTEPGFVEFVQEGTAFLRTGDSGKPV